MFILVIRINMVAVIIVVSPMTNIILVVITNLITGL